MKANDNEGETSESDATHSLTSPEALKVLIADLDSVVARFHEKNKHTFRSVFKLVVFENPFSFWPNFVYTFFVTILALVVFIVSADYWFLIEATLFFIVVSLNCFFVAIDSMFTCDEFASKVSRLVEYLKTIDDSKLGYCDLRNIEFFPTSSVCRVVRDGRSVVVPSSLIVRGDIIALLPGERPPCSATHLPDYLPSERHVSIGADSIDSGLKASDLLSDRTTVVPYPNAAYYKLTETPIILKIEEELFSNKQRVPPPIRRLVLTVQRWQFFIVIPVAIALAVLFVAIVAVLHGYSTMRSIVSDLFPFVIHSIFAISIPFLPTMLTILRIHGNALIVDESKRLLSTRNERADSGADEAYEHVEIIRPTALFTLSKMLVFRDLLLGRLPDSLPRNGNILLGFANLNYLCAIDKEGVLSSPKPVLQKLLIFSSASQANSASQQNMPRNVSFGTFMSSDTVSSAQGKHCRLETLHAITKMQNGSLHLDFDEKQWFRHLGVLKALGLNMVVTSSQLYSERYRQFINYLNSPYFRSIVDSPTTLTPPPTATSQSMALAPPHLDVVNMHTFSPLTERIGFRSEQTLANYKVEEFVGIYSAAFPSPLRRAFATICRDVASPSMANSLQLFCQGHPDLILSMCSDFWDGQDLHPFTPGIRARVKDFCNRQSNTGYCVALSYAPLSQALRPFNPDACLRFAPRNEFPSSSASASPMMASSAHNLAPRWSDFIEESNQIFIGVAVLQSQPLMPVIQLVQNLKTACSRFVYFSRESELMSRAFAEKLGLEANWNCFISLADSKEQPQQAGSQPNAANGREDEREAAEADTDEASKLLGRPTGIVASVSCAPAVAAQESSIGDGGSIRSNSPTADGYPTKRQRQVSTASGAPVISIKTSSSAPNLSLFCVEEGDIAGRASPINIQVTGGGGSSNAGDTANDELSSHASTDLINVIENRAQLPRGIKEVRPHIAECDNVPLLVSLFTDSNKPAVDEMMSIMAENNGVVCSLGSSMVTDNFSSFSRTDCAVSVLPLAPVAPHNQIRASPSSGGSFVLTGSSAIPTPASLSQQYSAAISAGLQQQARDIYSDIASRLVSLPCSLSIRPNRICYLLQLLAQCRHYVACIKQVFFYAAFAYSTIVLAHYAHLITDRALPLSPLQFLWLTLFAIPVLAMSLITSPIDENILNQPPHRARVTSATVAATMCYFLATFLPAVPLCLCLTFLFDYFMWNEYAAKPIPIICLEQPWINSNSSSIEYLLENTTTTTSALAPNLTFPSVYQFIPPWWKTSGPLPKSCSIDEAFSQNFIVLSSELSSVFLGLYILILATGFVFPLAPVWSQNPFRVSKPFCTLLATTILGTIILALLHIFITTIPPSSPSFKDVSPFSWALAFVTPCLIALPAHELFKLRRIKKILRQLKRIRLEFNTRLGLNSPF